MRGELRNCVVKNLGWAHFDTSGTQTAYPLNLTEIATATTTGQKFTWCKLIWAGMKTGAGFLASAAMTPLTGTTVSCATPMTHYPITVPTVSLSGADHGHGYCYAAGTVETGRFWVSYDIDLMDSQVRTWLGCTVAVVCTSTDDVDSTIIAVLGGAREAPVDSLTAATAL